MSRKFIKVTLSDGRFAHINAEHITEIIEYKPIRDGMARSAVYTVCVGFGRNFIETIEDPAAILALINSEKPDAPVDHSKIMSDLAETNCSTELFRRVSKALEGRSPGPITCTHCGKPFTAGMSCGECGPRVDYKALNSLMDQLNSWKVAAVALADAVAESGDDVNDINVHKAFDNVRRLETGKTPQSAVKQAATDVALLEAAEFFRDQAHEAMDNTVIRDREPDYWLENDKHASFIRDTRAAVEGKSC